MRFSDGNWLNRKGVTIDSPHEINDFWIEPKTITVFAPVQHLRDRGDTLQGPLLTLKLSSPMPDVIRVQSCHFTGEPELGPYFQVHADADHQVQFIDNEEELGLTSGNLSVMLRKTGEWSMGFIGAGKKLTSSSFRGLGYVTTDDGGVFMRDQLALGVGEYVYGLGERFTPFVKNGQTVDIWNEDGGTSTEQAYKNIPFYLTNKGYGVFVSHPERVSFEVGSEKVSKVQFSVPGETLDYYVIYGPTPKEILDKYTSLTGKPALPPTWTFGLWLSTSFLTDYDEKTVNSIIEGMAQRDLPVHVFHFDCFWMKEYEWSNLEWDKRVFPDPEGMLARLKEKGLKVSVWINPYIAQKSRLFEEAKAGGYLLKKPNGGVWQWDMWQPGMGIVDFTNPKACEWFAGHLRKLLDMGVSGFKTDFGERIPTDVVYYDGSDPVKMHNYYTYLYNQVVFNVLKERFGEGEAVVFARSATAGSQQFPVHWGGDCYATYDSMAESLRGGLSLGLSGFGFWSHDIGGFENTAPADVYKRWVAFGLLSSHSRLHGSKSYRVPWLFDEEAVDVLRHFTKLKARLMPYLYDAAREASQGGVPVMRAMVLEFPQDPGCATLDRQYMLGDSILVAPIFNKEGEVDFYLPSGIWTDLLTGMQVKGGGWRHEKHGFMSLPLYVRPNSLIAIGHEEQRPDYDYALDVELHLFHLEEGRTATAVVPDQKGNQALCVSARRDKGSIEVQAEGTGVWTLVLRSTCSVASVEGGSVETSQMGVRIVPDNGASKLTIRLQKGI